MKVISWIRYKYIPLLLAILLLTLSQCSETEYSSEQDYSDKYKACLNGGSSTSLEIVTFNVEHFPLAGSETLSELAGMIKAINADIIAFQEIASKADFQILDNMLEAYSGIMYPIDNSDWNLAYLYKDSEISISSSKIIFEDDFWAFPRPPFELHARHKPSMTDLIVLNNHLKCCDGSEDRRRSASDQLYSYINNTYPNDAVIVLGDLNDEIDGSSYSSNVFWSFVNDHTLFKVADMEIAKGSVLWWSYPSYPSHIDHIIVSNELFGMIDTTMVLKPEACFSKYPTIISDHRPVYLRLK